MRIACVSKEKRSNWKTAQLRDLRVGQKTYRITPLEVYIGTQKVSKTCVRQWFAQPKDVIGEIDDNILRCSAECGAAYSSSDDLLVIGTGLTEAIYIRKSVRLVLTPAIAAPVHKEEKMSG